MRFFVLCIVFVLLTGNSAFALEILSVNSKEQGRGEKVSVRLSRKVDAKVFRAEQDPPRIVIDLPTARWKNKKKYSSKLIKNVRLAGHDADTSRLVIELTREVELKPFTLSAERKKGYRLDFAIEPVISPRKESVFGQFKPSATRPVVVIDPGHGGQDPGATGIKGMKEKQVTLAFAMALSTELTRTGKFRVVLTREDDTYLFLRDRVKIARQAKADLFISLHADSAPNEEARGLSVYTISEKASDKEAEALAAKENKADIIGGIDLSDTSEDVADILIDLAERETRGNSAQFAKTLIRSLSREVEMLSNTHRFAGFAVLKAPDVPSVLVELGFLSSPQEEKLLESDHYRRKVVRGLARAVETYFEAKKKTRRGS